MIFQDLTPSLTLHAIHHGNFRNGNFVEERRDVAMKKWVSILLALAFLGAFSIGCAGTDKEKKVKCPKCGAIFTVDEGLEGIRRGMPEAPK